MSAKEYFLAKTDWRTPNEIPPVCPIYFLSLKLGAFYSRADHSASRKPTSTKSSATRMGRLTSIPSVASSAS